MSIKAKAVTTVDDLNNACPQTTYFLPVQRPMHRLSLAPMQKFERPTDFAT